MNRVNKNLRWIERELAKAGEHNILESEILDALNASEVDVCQEWGAIKSQEDLSLIADQDEYTLPPGTHLILEREEPSTWTKRLGFTSDPTEFVEFKKRYTNGTQPLMALFFAGKLTFHPAPTAAATLPLWLIGVPVTPMKEDGDPSVSEDWDFALRYGALSRLIGGDWFDKFQHEAAKRGTRLADQQVSGHRIQHSSRRLGF